MVLWWRRLYIYFKKFVKSLKSKGFKLNPYDPCVANKPRRPSLITRVGRTVPKSPAARPAVAPYVATGVADLTLVPLSRTAFKLSSVPTQATLEFMRMQRRQLNASAISGRRSSRTPRSARISPPLTTVTSTTQARSAFGSRSSSLSPLLLTPPALAHQSLA